MSGMWHKIGSTLVVARDIAERLGASLVPIASVIDRDTIDTEADVIGVVSPKYYGEPPLIVQEFMQKLSIKGDKYIFAVPSTGGFYSPDSDREAKQ